MVRGLGFGCTVALTTAFLAVVHPVFSAPATAAEPPSAAQVIAQKFAENPAEKIAPKPQVAPKQPVAETPVVAPFAKSKAVAETATTPQRPPLDYEMDMLRRARAEQAELEKVAPAPSAPVPVAPSLKKAVAPVTPPPTQSAKTPPSAAAVIPVVAPAVTPAPVPQKLVEAPAQTAPSPKPDVAKAETAAPAAPPAAVAAPTQPATILLSIELDSASSAENAGQSHDPIICFAETCFVSAGLSADAVKISKGDALKLKSTAEISRESCKGKIACAYRNVALQKGALLQLIELGSASNDPSRTYLTEPDASCKAAAGVLTCNNPIATPDFKVWVVPEATAKAAGTPAIEDAIAENLPHQDVARDSDK